MSLEERQRATSSRQERATPKEHRGAAEEQRGFPSAVQHATLLFIVFSGAQLAVHICDDLELNRKMFPDSTIATQMALKMKRKLLTKVTSDY